MAAEFVGGRNKYVFLGICSTIFLTMLIVHGVKVCLQCKMVLFVLSIWILMIKEIDFILLIRLDFFNWRDYFASNSFFLIFKDLSQGSQTQIGQRDTFQRKYAPQTAVQWEKSLRRPQTIWKALETSYIWTKINILSIFEMFEGHTNASGGPRVWDPWSKLCRNM